MARHGVHKPYGKDGKMHDHHSHSHGASSVEEAKALLQFTLKHNRSHEEELHELGHALEHLGLADAAKEVWNSLEDSRHASEHIEKAIEAMGQ